MEKSYKINKILMIAAYNSNGKTYGKDENIDFSECILASYWYLHGRLVNIIGYDKGLMLNAKKLGFVNKDNESNIVGIIPVFIYNIKEPCIGYFWVEDFFGTLIQRGYVCLFSDIKGRKQALREFIKGIS